MKDADLPAGNGDEVSTSGLLDPLAYIASLQIESAIAGVSEIASRIIREPTRRSYTQVSCACSLIIRA